MTKSTKIVVCPVTGDRLCRDNRWRSFANFGTYSSCVKTYRLTHAALRAGERFRHPHNTGRDINLVICLHEGDSMDASGKVSRSTD